MEEKNEPEKKDPGTNIFLCGLVVLLICFETVTAFWRAQLVNQERTWSVRPLYETGGVEAIVSACSETPVERLGLYTACRLQYRPEGTVLVLATYPDFDRAQEMAEAGFTLRDTILLSKN
ncbi:MAG: hypothetical protein AAB903_03795 [Patescibacteria group bacterium]